VREDVDAANVHNRHPETDTSNERRCRLLKVASAVLVCLFACAASAAPKINPIFAPILPALRAATSVPTLLLPSALPRAFPPNLAASPVTSRTVLNYYHVVISTVQGCIDESCETASILGEASDPHYPLSGEAVTLKDGVHAFYLPFDCDAAGCHESTITFDRAGIRYAVGIKAGRKEDVIVLASFMAAVRR
jgi:hypothetical protein